MKSKEVALDNRAVIRPSVVHAYNVTRDDRFSLFEPQLLDWSLFRWLTSSVDVYYTQF